jgi:hypothetical protein
MYFALDFANPLMPGAVQFERGSVHTVEADRARPTVPVVSIDVVPVPETVLERADDTRAVGAVRPIIDPQRRAVMCVRRRPAPPSDSGATSEDH